MKAAVKDPLWWIHPDYRGKGSFPYGGLMDFPTGSIKVVNPDDAASLAAQFPVRIDSGEFSSLAMILFMINGHKPGPISGFYVIVEAEKGKTWCVGQMHADAETPVRVFGSHMYPSEEEARAAAERLRLADVGNAPPRA